MGVVCGPVLAWFLVVYGSCLWSCFGVVSERVWKLFVVLFWRGFWSCMGVVCGPVLAWFLVVYGSRLWFYLAWFLVVYELFVVPFLAWFLVVYGSCLWSCLGVVCGRVWELFVVLFWRVCWSCMRVVCGPVLAWSGHK